MNRLHPVLGRQSHSVLSCRAPSVSRLPEESATVVPRRGCNVGGSKRAFCLANEYLQWNGGNIGAASDIRTPTDIWSVRTEGRLRLSVVLAELAVLRRLGAADEVAAQKWV